jgi:integrase
MCCKHLTNERSDLEGLAPPIPLPYSPDGWIVAASGLRYSELLNVRVRDMRLDEAGRMWIHVAKQAGRGEREVPVLSGYEDRVLNHIQNLRLFPSYGRIAHIQQARVEYATRLYYLLLKEKQEQYCIGEYNEEIMREVMKALGHTKLSVVCRYYLHLKEMPADQESTRDSEAEHTSEER